MTTAVSLDSTPLRLEAGDEVSVELQIHNNSRIVELYEISVVGVPAAWATVEPTKVPPLHPGTTGTATVTFRPPRSSLTPAGEQPFGVKVVPTEQPELTVTHEGVVEVLPFLEPRAELIPRTSQGRRGRHKVAVDNRGNVPMDVLVLAVSDGEGVSFKVNPVGPAIGPGEAKFVSVTVKARKRIWRGQPVTHPFVVSVEPQVDNAVELDSTPVELDGSYVQTPVIPKWLLWLLLGLLLLACALLALWFWLLKPTIESQAEEAAEAAAEQAEEAAEEATVAATEAKKAADETENPPGGDPKKAPGRRVAVTDVSPRLNVLTGGIDTDAFELPGPADTFALTDLVISNPQGDFGRVQVIVDDDIRLEHALENFRDLDFHFVSPIMVNDDVTLRVLCRSPGEPPDAAVPDTCDVSVLLGGELTSPVER